MSRTKLRALLRTRKFKVVVVALTGSLFLKFGIETDPEVRSLIYDLLSVVAS